jgi:serine/threonine-protein kinase
MSAAISPDGRHIVFPVRSGSGRGQLATRLLDQSNATVLPSTEGGRDPFFKPDGQWIGFFADNKLALRRN